MADIIINGMEMPKNEPLLIKLNPDGSVSTTAKNDYWKYAAVPAADVEPVVRCRECKHHYWVQEPCHGKSVHYCKLPHMRGIEIFKEFFCYYGERKEGDN